MMMRDYGRSNGTGYGRGYQQPRLEQEDYRGRRSHDEDRFTGNGHEQRGGRDTVRHAELVKVIEVLAESDHSWEDAAQRALREASRTVRNIKSIYVKDMQAVVRDGRIVGWRLNAKISFALEGQRRDERERDRTYY